MAEEKTRTRTKTIVNKTPRAAKKEEPKMEEIKKDEVAPVTPKHILSISDERGLPLLFIGNNFNELGLESKISVINHLKNFITNQKSSIIKMVEDL